MERLQNIFVRFLFLIFCFSLLLNAQQIAFPSAEGFGKYTTGGRGGAVYHVTNLDDSGPGSFRDAVSQPNRTVVFDVGGVININERITVNKNITIAGQTGPGGGITIYGNGVAFNATSGNNIVRYIRIRMGQNGDSGKDAISISDNQDNYIFDHVSVSWGLDGTFDINTSSDNITLQDCIIGQGINLENHSTGALIQCGPISIIRTLWIDNKTRNPKIRFTHEYINSVIYNWRTDGYIMGGTEGLSEANVMGNYFIAGPESSTSGYITRTTASFHLYPQDNWYDNNKNGTLDGFELIADSGDYKTATIETTPYDYPGVNSLLSAQEAVTHIINSAGASIIRDAVDSLLISQLNSFGTEGQIITTEEDNGIPGNVGTVVNGTPPTDTDQDGMPDSWEEANSLDKDDPDDRNDDADNDGFTNLEEYLNSIIGDTMWVPPPPVSPPSIDISYRHDYTSVLLNWITYNFGSVMSVHLYQSESEDLSNPQVYSIEKDQDTFTIGSLTAGATYYFAFSITDSSHIESFLGDTIAVAPGETFTSQAEDASHIGSLSVDSNHLGFNGSGFINFDASNSAVEFANMPGFGGGECTLLYRYALGKSDRTGSLIVNGATSSLTMHSTTEWTNWITDSIKINLEAGYGNTIRFAATGNDFGNLDEITIVPENLTSIEGENNSEALSQFELYQNYPNPFNPATTIIYKLAENSYVKLKVYDMLGREVAKLVDEQKKPGAYSAIFNAENLASGVYFYVLKAGNIVLMKKSILLK